MHSQKSAAGVARHRPGERETTGPVATRALTEDSVEMEFLTDDPVAQAVACQRVTFDGLAPRCGRYGCATAGRVSWTRGPAGRPAAAGALPGLGPRPVRRG